MGKVVEKVCKTCGEKMKLKPAQIRKKMSTGCAYELKKIRSSVKYWEKKVPNSVRHQYWVGRYQSMIKMLNK